MANLSKIKRDRMLAFLNELKKTHNDDASIRAFNEIENHLVDKKYGLVWEEHTEEVEEKLKNFIPILCADKERRLCKDPSLPWNFIIEGDNLQALYLLEKTHKGKVDCIYIDPPYNTGARDWKYNNDYVDSNDLYRHSKWLSMMESRLRLAKRLLNPDDSVLICTIDEKEYLHLGCLLEELFPEARIQMVSSVINPAGVSRDGQFARTDEYIFFLMLGKCSPSPLLLDEDWRGNIKGGYKDKLRWNGLQRSGTSTLRSDRPNMFYPIFISKDGSKIVNVGESIPINTDRKTINVPDGQIAIWPIFPDGREGRWRLGRETLLSLIEKHYVHIGRIQGERASLTYLAQGEQEKVEKGEFPIIGYNNDGSIIVDESNYQARFIPGTQWWIKTHDATQKGTKMLNTIVGHRFSFPKSVYAVHDAIRFFVNYKPNSIIIDFFAGSGTTLHAVNLLNAEDGGHRKCIMVTNNEISDVEEKEFIKRGINKGDQEWEARGIAQFVTWPRTVCSIEGHDIKGNLLKGDYLGSNRPMADGFQANVKYFKCDWTDRHPEDYLLSNILCLHIREMIELQNAIEVDGKKNVLILNKGELKQLLDSESDYNFAERIWVNQNIIMNSDELKKIEAKGFSYIPREFFGQELKEAAE